MRSSISLFASLIICFSLVSSVSAEDLLFDNEAGGSAGITNGRISDLDGSTILADEFVLSEDVEITRVEWTGMYSFDNTPPPTDDITFAIFSHDGLGPGSQIMQVNVGDVVNRIDSGIDCCIPTFDIFEYWADVDFGLGPPSMLQILRAF